MNGEEPFDIMFLNSDKISEIKQQIYNIIGVSIETQRLFYKEELLEDNENIGKYGVQKDDTIQLEVIE